MRRLGLLGAALVAALALGALACGAALGSEPGLLYLPKEGPPFKFEAKAGAGEVTTASGIRLNCTEAVGTRESSEKAHVVLGTGRVAFKGCKQMKGKSETACNSEGDAAGTILVPIDWHAVSVLTAGGELAPGVAATPLGKEGKPFKFTCAAGTAIVEARGWGVGQAKTSNLTSDIESVQGAVLTTGGTCDTADTLCTKLEESEPCEINFTGKFEKAEVHQEGTITWTPMMLMDD